MRRRFVASALTLGLALSGYALASPASAQDDFAAVEIETVPIRNGLHLLVGRGGNILVSTGSDGPVLVDDQFAPLAPKIEAAVRALQGAPVRFVVNTHWHGDHTGGNEPFGKAGALLVAHENVRRRMSTTQFMKALGREVPASPDAALPVVTFTHDVTLHWNGEEIDVEHVDPAHTDGDSHVWFRTANVVHTGDTYVAGMFPFVDASSGGTLGGLIGSADRLLAQADADTVVVPGHGPLSNAAELRAWRAMLVDVRGRVEAAIAAGKSLEDFQAERPLADLEPTYGGGSMSAERFVAILWEDLGPKS